jgi:hypothetical protein
MEVVRLTYVGLYLFGDMVFRNAYAAARRILCDPRKELKSMSFHNLHLLGNSTVPYCSPSNMPNFCFTYANRDNKTLSRLTYQNAS